MSKSTNFFNKSGVRFDDLEKLAEGYVDEKKAKSPFGQESVQPERFQELAMMLIVSVKSLMAHLDQSE